MKKEVGQKDFEKHLPGEHEMLIQGGVFYGAVIAGWWIISFLPYSKQGIIQPVQSA